MAQCNVCHRYVVSVPGHNSIAAAHVADAQPCTDRGISGDYTRGAQAENDRLRTVSWLDELEL